MSQNTNNGYNLADILDIDQANLSNEYATQAAKYGFFATQLSTLERKVKHAELARDSEYASADLMYRDEFSKKGIKFTETTVKSSVLTDDVYLKSEGELHDAIAARDTVKAIVKALEMRAEMLISLGATMRHEYNMTGMSLKDDVADKISKLKEEVKRKK